MANAAIEKIEKEIKSNKVVVFVKGTPAAPQCGFSAATMELLNELKVPFRSVDVLAHPDIRMALPEYSHWPTFPQIFIEGKLVGGCDIIHEMRDSGELQKLLHIS